MRDRPAGCSTCASSLCGALCGNGRSPAAGIDGLLVAIGRRRGFGAAPAMMVVMRSGTTNTTLAATQRHPCRSGMVTADCARSRSCSESVVAPAALNDHQNLAALIIFAALYARVRRWDADDGTGGAMRGRGWRARAPSSPETGLSLKRSRRRRRHHHRAATSRCTDQAARAGRDAPRRNRGHHPPRDKEHQLASRKCRRESTPQPPPSTRRSSRAVGAGDPVPRQRPQRRSLRSPELHRHPKPDYR